MARAKNINQSDACKQAGKKPIEQYKHTGKERINNPPVGLVTPETDKETGKKQYAYDPHLDPALQLDSQRSQIENIIDNGLTANTLEEAKSALSELKKRQKPYLNWAGKAEHISFEVPTVSLHVHERIDPRTIIEAVRKRNGQNYEQLSLFKTREENPPLREAIEFYKHRHNWSNRLIAGDSLLVMNSLIEKEGLSGQVQMIYFDPPYGIKYGSNFQPFVNKRDVKDGKDEDLTQEPEMIKAFRDTWELGIHSYLTYLRDRLLLSRELLTESGSVFVQISDENVHLVRCLMDDVFGVGNFVTEIVFRKKGMTLGSNTLERMNDLIVWYAKDKDKIKYRQLYEDYNVEGASRWTMVELADGTRRKLIPEEYQNHTLLPKRAKVFRLVSQRAPSFSPKNVFDFKFEGKVYKAPGCWVTNQTAMENLAKSKRFYPEGSNLSYIQYLSDFPMKKLTNLWMETSGTTDKIYVVQTSEKVISRCLLMTTDPGDLVFDPTCVRKGTKILIPLDDNPVNETPLSHSAKGSHINTPTNDTPLNPPVNGGTIPPSPFTGRVGVGFVPVESIQPGNYVYSHDGKPHLVTRTIKRRFQGTMIGILHTLLSEILWLTEDHRVLIKTRRHAFTHHRDWSHVPTTTFARARTLRKRLTAPEQKLWSKLRGEQLGVKFRRQHPVGPYIADFYCAERSLVLEIDGDSHFSEEGKQYDSSRTEYMTNCGLTVLRFINYDIQTNLAGVVSCILAEIGESAEHVPEDTVWIMAGNLLIGDTVFFGVNLTPVQITALLHEDTIEDVYDIEVEGTHSFLTEVCAVHNCGSGTTAYVAEQWGRRWITCDTSRVATTLAKQRLMTALFDYYELAHPDEGVGSGFKYKTVPHITLKSIANNEPPARETLYDQPFVDNKRTRVTGPFTVEAVPAPMVKPITPHPHLPPQGGKELATPSPLAGEGWGEGEAMDSSITRSGETMRQAEWRGELLKCGIRGKHGQKILFSRVEPLPGTRWLQAEAETKPNDLGADTIRDPKIIYGQPQRVVISFGPEHAPLEQRQVALAIEEAQKLVPKPNIIVFASFQFDPEASKDIDETNWPGVTLLKVQMNTDLLTDDLKKKRASNESFWLMGQPDVRLEKIKEGKDKGKYLVETLGFDYYNTKTGIIESGGTDKIALWMLDTDYDGRSLFPRQVFFPMSGEKDGWSRLAKNLKAEIDEELIDVYRGTVSLPFEPGKNRRIAVKIVDDRGIESLKILEIP